MRTDIRLCLSESGRISGDEIPQFQVKYVALSELKKSGLPTYYLGSPVSIARACLAFHKRQIDLSADFGCFDQQRKLREVLQTHRQGIVF